MGVYILVSTIMVCFAFECFLSASIRLRRRRRHLDVMHHTSYLKRVFLCLDDACYWVDIHAIDDLSAYQQQQSATTAGMPRGDATGEPAFLLGM